MSGTAEWRYIDLFAGMGLVQCALSALGWQHCYSIDNSSAKYQLYNANFPESTYDIRDIRTLSGGELPRCTLVHASFPCTDLSVAGARLGFEGNASALFWEVARLLREMGGKQPPLVMLENVEGLLTSNSGRDIEAILTTLADLGYAVDIAIVDAAHFVPQSRRRLFIVGKLSGAFLTSAQRIAGLLSNTVARPPKIQQLIRTHRHLPWHLAPLPSFPRRARTLASIIDSDEEWWPDGRRDYLLNQMHRYQRDALERLQQEAYWNYGTAFRRMRLRDGRKQSTAEIRLDGIAGCLRTPKGGSARQIVFRVGFGQFDARLLNARECARLMGADNYHFPTESTLNDALYGLGDAVCVPAVQWVAETMLHPSLRQEAGSTHESSLFDLDQYDAHFNYGPIGD